MYWRKANAIHKWFVDNVQEGEDDCKEYYVEKEMLEKLRDVCKEVLDKAILKDGLIINGYSSSEETNHEFLPNFEEGQYIVNAEEIHKILSTNSGFFFGSTNYDKFYYDDIKYTYETLNKILNVIKDNFEYEFYYSSSW